MKTNYLSAICLALALWAAGCGQQPPTSHEHTTNSGQHVTEFSTNVTAYQVKGVLRDIRANGTKALIAHEDIPGYMEAMTMLLDVRDTNELAGVQPGDQITFRMLVTDDDGWIDRVKRTGLNVSPSQPLDSPPAVIPEELEVGAPLPDCVLTNQLGQTIRLSDFKGRVLAFTFIFTRCPFPTYCPRMNNNLATAQKQLLAANTGTNWHLLSISFDPDFDTPAQLARYATGYGYNPAHWSFATGSTDEIRKLGVNFGLTFVREGASINHNVRTVVVDAAGRVQKVFAGNEWQPAELVEEMKRAMKSNL